MSLYFIAIIPHIELRELIQSLKEEMKGRFNAKHALKSPAHITLQMPFKRNNEDEYLIIEGLQNFASRHKTFNIDLIGFGCFSPRVIFIKVKDHKPIIELHSNLKKVLVNELSFKEHETSNKIHPHMTIATRDLTEDAFFEAWPEFEKRKLKVSFTVKSIYLLKHNGKFWDIYKEFPFREKNNEL